RRSEVDHGIAGEVAAGAGVLDAFFYGRDELTGDGAPEDIVHELEVRSAWQRFHLDFAVAELTVTARLLLVAPVCLGRAFDRLAVGDSWRFEVDVDAKPALELGDRHFNVQLPLS